MASTFTIIRNGRLVDLQRRAAVPADILIDRDVILTIGAPGMEGPQRNLTEPSPSSEPIGRYDMISTERATSPCCMASNALCT